eukprot:g410.t1
MESKTSEVPESPTKKSGGSRKNVFMLNASKKEKFTAKSGFRKLFRKIRSLGYKTVDNKDPLCDELMEETSVFITACPTEAFTDADIAVLEKFVENGGKLVVLANEGGIENSNLGTFLTNYGIRINDDAVVRTVYYKYLHPKEVFISSGVLSKDFLKIARKFAAAKKKKLSKISTAEMKIEHDTGEDKGEKQVPFVYPYGATLEVSDDALPLLSSGFISFPMSRPIAAVSPAKKGSGSICVLGASAMFSDRFLNKEQNSIVLEVLVHWLSTEGIEFYRTERDTKAAISEIAEKRQLPHTEALAERLRPCLEENERLPQDFTKLFDTKMFKFGTEMIPEACKLYKLLDIKDEALSLIAPQFECPLPKLEPAIFPPSLREPPPPALDQFDLDEEFASERGRLAQLTNKCKSDRDVDYYVKQCAEILNITPELPEGSRNAKNVLEFVLRKLVDFKKLEQSSSRANKAAAKRKDGEEAYEFSVMSEPDRAASKTEDALRQRRGK